MSTLLKVCQKLDFAWPCYLSFHSWWLSNNGICSSMLSITTSRLWNLGSSGWYSHFSSNPNSSTIMEAMVFRNNRAFRSYSYCKLNIFWYKDHSMTLLDRLVSSMITLHLGYAPKMDLLDAQCGSESITSLVSINNIEPLLWIVHHSQNKTVPYIQLLQIRYNRLLETLWLPWSG